MNVKGYFKNIQDAMKNSFFRNSLLRSVTNYRALVKTTLKDKGLIELVKEAREIKEYSIEHMEELTKQLMDSFIDNGGDAYLAKDREQAIKIITEVIKPGDIVVKGKSMTCEELGLREFLSEYGVEIWETDLGELIIQLANRLPMHPVEPAVGLSKEYIIQLLRDKLKVEISDKVEDAVKAVRNFLRNKYVSANVGISGANVAAAEEGAILTIENEGNIRLSTGLPEKYIAIVGMEKIVPRLQDAFKVLEVIWRYAGYKIPTYINMISGPSKTGDIEKFIVKGAHGPREAYLIVIDNGRTRMKKEGFKEALYCIRCGACIYECPLFPLVGGYFGFKYVGGIGAIWATYTINEIIGFSISLTCMRAGRCYEVCPMKINIPNLIVKLREKLLEKYKDKLLK